MEPRARLIPFVCIGGPVLGYLLEQTVLAVWGFSFGFALLPVNGLITAAGLGLISLKKPA